MTARGGYTLVEIQVAVLLIGILGAMGVVGVQSALPALKTNSAMDQVVGAMRLGRESAITQRRRVEVQFIAPNRIDLVRDDNLRPVLASVTMESNPSFQITAGLPDTPDAFGNTSAVDFGGAALVRFNPDGTLTDAANVPVNGTIFIGAQGEATAARAVTITGVTGRAQGYRWTGRLWEEQ